MDFSNIWNFIPLPSAESIVMLCYNALKMHIVNPATLSNVPSNIVLVEYGFQVRFFKVVWCLVLLSSARIILSLRFNAVNKH